MKIRCAQIKGGVDALSHKSDASLTNINFGDIKKYNPVSNSDSERQYKTLSPSLKKDIIVVSKQFRDRAFTYTGNRNREMDYKKETNHIYVNRSQIGNDDDNNSDLEFDPDNGLYQNLDVPSRKGSDDSSPNLNKKKPKPLPKPRVSREEKIDNLDLKLSLKDELKTVLGKSSKVLRKQKRLTPTYCDDPKSSNDNEEDPNDSIYMNTFIHQSDEACNTTDFKQSHFGKSKAGPSNSQVKHKKSFKTDKISLDCPNSIKKDNFITEDIQDNVYVNALINLPDDEKVKISPGSENDYIAMDKNHRESYVTMDSQNFERKSDTHVEYGSHIDLHQKPAQSIKGYVSMDNRKLHQIRRSIPHDLSKNCLSVHNKGDHACMYEPLDYTYVYELNPEALRNNAHPFIRKKEKATSIPCLCPGHDGVSPKLNPKKDKTNDVNRSQLVYYSCENVDTNGQLNESKTSTDFKKIEKIQIPQASTSNNSVRDLNAVGDTVVGNNVVFRPFSSEARETDPDTKRPGIIRRITVIKKKFEQIKVLFTEWE